MTVILLLFIENSDWSPFITKVKTSSDGSTEIEGIYADIWSVISERLNFTTYITETAQRSWSFMLKELAKKQDFDIVLTGNSLTEKRSSSADFSFTLQMTSLRMFYARETFINNVTGYLTPFPLCCQVY